MPAAASMWFMAAQVPLTSPAFLRQNMRVITQNIRLLIRLACAAVPYIHHLVSSNKEGEYVDAGATALMAAAGKGRLADVAALLTAGADPLLRSRDGSSAQDWATKFGHAETAEFLGSQMEVPCSSSCSHHKEYGPRICHCGRSVMDVAVSLLQARTSCLQHRLS